MSIRTVESRRCGSTPRPVEIRAALAGIDTLDILVNNAGVALYDDLGDVDVLARHLAVNLYASHAVTQAAVPKLADTKGSVINVLSTLAFAPLPVIASYSISKAAAFSMTQSLRAILAPKGISVHAVPPGIVDTDMSSAFDVPKATPAEVAKAVFDGVEAGEEDIFPDAMAQTLAESWRTGAAKELERQNAAFAASIVVGA